jgi:hypothetical protein
MNPVRNNSNRTSIANEMREERRRVPHPLAGSAEKRDRLDHIYILQHNPERSHICSCCADGRELWACEVCFFSVSMTTTEETSFAKDASFAMGFAGDDSFAAGGE